MEINFGLLPNISFKRSNEIVPFSNTELFIYLILNTISCARLIFTVIFLSGEVTVISFAFVD